MAYTHFDRTKPDATVQNISQMGDSERNNLRAIRDACLMGGGFFGWNMAAAGGTAEEPATLTYSSGTERVRATLTWSGGDVSQAVYAYSADSGANWDAIGTKTITYDGNGNVTATTWS